MKKLKLNAVCRLLIRPLKQLSYRERSKKKLFRFYQEAVLSCIKNNVSRWWHFLPNSNFNCAISLHVFLSGAVLQRAGDYNEFIRIKNKLNKISAKKDEDFYYDLAQSYKKSMEEIEKGSWNKRSSFETKGRLFVIGVPVWGAHYVSMLLSYCLPSLLTKGNLSALAQERKPIFVIHTDVQGQTSIDESVVIKKIKEMGIVVLYKGIDPELVRQFPDNPGYKYWYLGMIQSLDLFFAKFLDADYHILLPDTVYSNNHFRGILNVVSQGYKTITRLGLSTCMEKICPYIDKYRHDEIISIPAADLAAFALDTIHSASWSWITTDKDMSMELPSSYMIALEGENTLHMLAAHQTILYLDRDILRKTPKRFYISLDSELDKIVPKNSPIYCPKAQDEIFLVEVTPENNRVREKIRNPIDEFARLFWYSTQFSMDYWRFFDEGIIDPLNRELIPHRSYMSEEKIQEAKNHIKESLLQKYPFVSAEEASKALEILEKVLNHPNAIELSDDFKEVSCLIRDVLQDLASLYCDAILCCIRNGVFKWWQFLPDANFNSVPVFNRFLRECILHRAGDYTEFLRLKKELNRLSLNSSAQDFFERLIAYYDHRVNELAKLVSLGEVSLYFNKPPFLIGCSIWGDRYLDLLLNYCFPSLLAPGNLAALCQERHPIIFIHTNSQGKQKIEESAIIYKIKALGVNIFYQMIDDSLVKSFDKDPLCKYWHLGMVQSLDLHLARLLNADYHLLMPDTIYSNAHFSGILNAVANGHKAIIRLILSTHLEEICPEIDKYRTDEVISICGEDLVALSINHLHSAFRPWNMTNKNINTELSNSHVIVFEGKNSVHMFSPHQTILYIDHEVIQNIPSRFFMTFDSELDKIIPEDCPIYCPKAEDAICLIEVTHDQQIRIELLQNTLNDFCRLFWYSSTQESMKYWRIFNEEIIDPVNRDMLVENNFMDEAEILQTKALINEALLNSYPQSSDAQKAHALNIIKAVQLHPETVDTLGASYSNENHRLLLDACLEL